MTAVKILVGIAQQVFEVVAKINGTFLVVKHCQVNA